MPHSFSPPSSPTVAQEDSIIQDAPLRAAGELEPSSSNEDENDNAVADNMKIEIKLDGIFEDDDDEEFPSSGPANGKIESSPPAAPV